MNQKYNKFETLFETAFTHFSNGGFREGTAITITPAFTKSDYFKQHYAGHPAFSKFLKTLIDDKVLFFIKRVVGEHYANVKDSNDNEGAGRVYLVLRNDPRTVQWPTELGEFTVPGDWDYVAVEDYDINLPPLDGVPNKYERPIGTNAKVYKMETDLGNQPTDNMLPSKNTSIPASPALSKRYA
jgi:hypothetical protein